MEAWLVSAMNVRKHFVREVFLILLCVAGIGLVLSTVLHKATNAYKPFIPPVSQALTHFDSHTLTRDSESSMVSAKKLHKSTNAYRPFSPPVSQDLTHFDSPRLPRDSESSMVPAKKLHKATNAYRPFIPPVSQALTHFDSHTLTRDSESSIVPAKKLHNATNAYRPFIPSVSQALTHVDSHTFTRYSESSMVPAKKLHKATNAYSPFVPPVSQARTHFDSHTLTRDSESSMVSAKKLQVKILRAPAPAPVRPAPPQDELDLVLAKTANPNRTIIVTALNGAWAEPNTMIDLFLESFHVGEGTLELLNNLLIVAMDAKAYNRCLQIHQHCYSLKTRGIDFSAEKLFMSEDYLKMMWRRLGFLGEILKRGYSIVFSDTDIIWLRNPLERLAEDADIQITCDKYNGNPLDVKNEANTGFMYVRSNERTISFYRYWYLSRRFYPGQKEQDVLNILKMTRKFAGWGLKFMFLETKYFGGFCERSPDLDDAYTMHANCCKGLKAKVIDLRNAIHEWAEYRNRTINSSSPYLGQWRPATACQNSWWI